VVVAGERRTSGAAGPPDDELSGSSWVDGPSWLVSIAAAAVIVAALAVGAAALADGGAPVSADDGHRALPRRSTSTVIPATTEAPASTAAPDTTPPTSTVAPVTLPPAVVPAGWILAGSVADGFTVALPAPPQATTVPVQTTSGPSSRSEYTVEQADGSIVSATSVPADLFPAGSEARLATVVDQVGRDLGVTPERSAVTSLGGGPALPFRATTPDGVVRGVAVDAGERVVSLVQFTPAGADQAVADATFDAAAATLRLS